MRSLSKKNVINHLKKRTKPHFSHESTLKLGIILFFIKFLLTLQIFTVFRLIHFNVISFHRGQYFIFHQRLFQLISFILFSMIFQFYLNGIIIISFLFHFFFIMIDHIFKYLHSIIRFTTIDKKNDFLNDLNVFSFLIKSMKFTFNFKIVKMFCGIEKHNAKTKNKNKKTQSMIERSYYLRISDRKSKVDYIRFEVPQAITPNNQIMNAGNMITNDDTIGFIQDFTILHDKNMTVYDATICHRQGKIRAHLIYKTNCRIYYDKRLIGKYDLLLQIIDTNFIKMMWPSLFSFETMLIMTISKHRMNNDYKKMMKRKNVFNEKTMITYIEAMKIELTFALSTSDFEEPEKPISKTSKHFMSNASTIPDTQKTFTSTFDQEFSAISFDDIVVVIDGIFSFDVFIKSNNQDGVALIET